jgi:hypothetical protein
MDKVRAKFKCDVVHDYGEHKEIRLSAVTSQEEGDENNTFWKYTPSGTVKIHICNPPAAKMFRPGREYYLDFTPAAE